MKVFHYVSSFFYLLGKKIAIKKHINQFIEFELNTLRIQKKGTLSYN